MSTTEPRRTISLLRVPPIRDYGAPEWFERLPGWLSTGGVLVVLLAISGFIRVHYLDGQYWSDEANTVGIASHSFFSIPGILWQGGGAPLYFFLLHFWIDGFGASEIATHALSVLIGLVSIPVGMWLGWSLFGRRAGFMLALLLAFNAFFTRYAEETRMYELMALLGLLATGGFLHAFVYRRRRYLWLFGVSLVLMVYTDAWGFFFWAAAAVALGVVACLGEDRRGLLLDGLLCFGGALIAYVPWLPTLIHQALHATAPWHFVPLLGANVPRQLLGSDRVDAVLALAVVAGLIPLFGGRARRSPEVVSVWALVVISVTALALSAIVSLAAPTWVARYFGPIVAPLLLLAALACTRSGIFGLVAVVVSCVFLANPASFIPTYKSDMRDVAAEVQGDLHRDDLVIVAQPEQAALAWYYLPGGLRYATMLGPDSHPSYMDWDGALGKLQRADPSVVLAGLVSSLAPGQHLLFIRPLTEGVKQWHQPWSQLVRRRAAQWSAALADDPALEPVPGGLAPHYYRGSCCVSSSAMVFTKR